MSAPPVRLPRKEILAVNCWLAPTAMAVLAGVICKRTGPTCAQQGNASASSRKTSVTEFHDSITFPSNKTLPARIACAAPRNQPLIGFVTAFLQERTHSLWDTQAGAVSIDK